MLTVAVTFDAGVGADDEAHADDGDDPDDGMHADDGGDADDSDLHLVGLASHVIGFGLVYLAALPSCASGRHTKIQLANVDFSGE